MTGTGSLPRLVDVAQRAGVSMRTVSNVVNGYVHVSDATRTKVLQAIDEMGYRPNLIARNLARGRTGLVSLVLPRLEMPYFASLAQRMLEAAEAEGVFVLIQQTHESHALELAALEGRFGQRIDGVVLSPTTLSDADVAARKSAVPLVLLGDREWGDLAPAVAIDQVAAAEAAVSHLISRGRRRIAIIGPPWQPERSLRHLGWEKALAGSGLAADPSLAVTAAGLTGQHGAAAGEYLLTLAELPDAVFCVTDWLALGVIRALQRAGVRVPEDVAVVGYDDIPYGRASNPTLTTIAPDRAQIAALALRSLAHQLDGIGAAGPIEAGWELIVRESSG